MNTQPQETPTFVFIHRQHNFYEYGCVIDLNSPFLDTNLVVAISLSPEIDQAVARAFPIHVIRHYYPDTLLFTFRHQESP